jgi:hypothetical protein
MSRHDIELDFPSLIGKEYELSDENFDYNCLAYALGDEKRWWEPPNGFEKYWPDGFNADTTVATAESIIRVSGFIVELQPSATPKTHAVAIYAQGNDWTHFAKFSEGKWSSKLGEGHDVQDIQLQDLEGLIYGKVLKILARPQLTI